MASRRGNHQTSHPVFKALAASSRREILRLLLARDEPVTEHDLVSHLVAIERGVAPTESIAGRHTIHVDLVHAELPALVDAGLIVRDRDNATVDTTTHPAFDDSRFQLLLEAELKGLDAALRTVANERRRVILTVLRDASTSLTRRELASRLLRSAETDLEPDTNAVEDVTTALYHVHLPVIDDAGLIEYDPETGRTTYTGHPALEEVFAMIYEPDKRLADSCDGFFGGLEAAYKELRQGTKQGTGGEATWPHFWRDPSHD